MGRLKSFLDTPEEFFIGAFLQFPLFYVVRWKIFVVMALCAILWRFGGWEHGSKLWRRIGVPVVVCGYAIMAGVPWLVLAAGPFMVWLAPSYGKEGILWKWFGRDLPVRVICFGWYWTALVLGYVIAVH